MKTLLKTLLVATAAAASIPGMAQQEPDMAQQKPDEHVGQPAASEAAAARDTATDMSEGEVRRVDKEGARITLRHGEIKNLDMPPMTMVFGVKDRAALDELKAGDKVRFKAINEAGKHTVTEIQVVQ